MTTTIKANGLWIGRVTARGVVAAPPGKVYFAPVGTDPDTEGAWQFLGYTPTVRPPRPRNRIQRRARRRALRRMTRKRRYA